MNERWGASFKQRNRKIGVYGSIYVNDGAVGQTIPTGTTPIKVTGFVTDGLSANVTNDVANDKITIDKIAGVYKVIYSVSFFASGAGTVWHVSPALNGVAMVQAESHRKVSNANDVGNMGGVGFIDVTTIPWDLDLRVHHDGLGDVTFTPEDMSLTIEYVGET